MEPYANLAEKLVERKLLSDEEMERVVKLQEEQQAPFTRLDRGAWGFYRKTICCRCCATISISRSTRSRIEP